MRTFLIANLLTLFLFSFAVQAGEEGIASYTPIRLTEIQQQAASLTTRMP